MSSKVPSTITCNKCNHSFPFTLYRSIWGEYPEYRKLVMSNQINLAICPSCKSELKIPYAFLYTNAVKGFAVWWEPVYDAQIDEDTLFYAKNLGEGNFYQTAPRIHDWEEFKYTIIRFETGELKCNPITEDNYKIFVQANSSANRRKRFGCLGSSLLFVLFFLCINHLL